MFEECTTLRFHVDDHAVGRLVLSVPERRNPLGWTFARELREVATWCDEMKAIRCLLIRAEGPWFSAGGDISSFRETSNLPVDMAGSTNDFHIGISKLLRMRADQPIMRRNGKLIAAGLRGGTTPDDVAAVVLEAMTSSDGRLQWPAGADARAIYAASRSAPLDEWAALGGDVSDDEYNAWFQRHVGITL